MRSDLPDIIADIYHRIADMERRHQNHRRTGTVAEIDAAKGVVRVKLNEDPKTGKPFLTGWIPWKEQAMGAIKTHFPPSVGEQVEVNSETGDLTDAIAEMSVPSNANPRPHDKAGETVIDMHNGQYRQHIDDAGTQTEAHAKDYKLRTGGIIYINCG